MKKIILLFLLLLLSLSFLTGQNDKALDADKEAIARAALDYCEGYYEGNAARMEQALSPNLTKRGLVFSPRSGASYLLQMNAPALIEGTRTGRGNFRPSSGGSIISCWISMATRLRRGSSAPNSMITCIWPSRTANGASSTCCGGCLWEKETLNKEGGKGDHPHVVGGIP